MIDLTRLKSHLRIDNHSEDDYLTLRTDMINNV
ncbi:phage head-tail connector protein [Piscirickettsia salmonis]|nr:phage head-tail connector protein [Piscirickettsia salmonis]